MRIVSYNVRYFGHALRGLASTVGPKRRVSTAIATLDPLPDVVCLQEVETTSFRSSVAHRPSHPGETQLQAFMGRMEEIFAAQGREMPYDAFYFQAHHYKLWDFSLYTTGLAILVNRKTLRVDRHNVEAPAQITYHHVERLKERKQSRICAHMRLQRDRRRARLPRLQHAPEPAHAVRQGVLGRRRTRWAAASTSSTRRASW